MDIYRFFHPHHNPRLHRTPLRQQEIGELEQAAAELTKALERAQKRSARSPSPPIMAEHFADLLKAMRFVVSSLQTLSDAHCGDSKADLTDLVNERSAQSGWETWTKLISEQLAEPGSRVSIGTTSNANGEGGNGFPAEIRIHSASS